MIDRKDNVQSPAKSKLVAVHISDKAHKLGYKNKPASGDSKGFVKTKGAKAWNACYFIYSELGRSNLAAGAWKKIELL